MGDPVYAAKYGEEYAWGDIVVRGPLGAKAAEEGISLIASLGGGLGGGNMVHAGAGAKLVIVLRDNSMERLENEAASAARAKKYESQRKKELDSTKL